MGTIWIKIYSNCHYLNHKCWHNTEILTCLNQRKSVWERGGCVSEMSATKKLADLKHRVKWTSEFFIKSAANYTLFIKICQFRCKWNNTEFITRAFPRQGQYKSRKICWAHSLSLGNLIANAWQEISLPWKRISRWLSTSLASMLFIRSLFNIYYCMLSKNVTITAV